MRLSAVKILGINVTNSPKKEILEEIKKGLFLDGKKSSVGQENRSAVITMVTPNPEQIVLSKRDLAYREILNRADVALPDGSGVVWAAQKNVRTRGGQKVRPIAEVIPGVEFMENLVGLAQEKRVRITLIGGYGDVAVKTLECLKGRYPGMDGLSIPVSGVQVRDGHLEIEGQNKPDGYFHEIARRIVSDGAKMVFIALGAPKQEYFMDALAASLRRMAKEPVLLMVVGGSFDIIAGVIPRAPVLFRRVRIPFFGGAVGGEWLWRLIREPWRVRRQIALIYFVWLVWGEAARSKTQSP